jgi:metallo-beta-lactamase family protein
MDSPMGVSAFDFENRKWHKVSLEDCIAINKMFTMITDYKETIDTIYNKRPKWWLPQVEW